jgi:hypothetical protein
MIIFVKTVHVTHLIKGRRYIIQSFSKIIFHIWILREWLPPKVRSLSILPQVGELLGRQRLGEGT